MQDWLTDKAATFLSKRLKNVNPKVKQKLANALQKESDSFENPQPSFNQLNIVDPRNVLHRPKQQHEDLNHSYRSMPGDPCSSQQRFTYPSLNTTISYDPIPINNEKLFVHTSQELYNNGSNDPYRTIPNHNYYNSTGNWPSSNSEAIKVGDSNRKTESVYLHNAQYDHFPYPEQDIAYGTRVSMPIYCPYTRDSNVYKVEDHKKVRMYDSHMTPNPTYFVKQSEINYSDDDRIATDRRKNLITINSQGETVYDRHSNDHYHNQPDPYRQQSPKHGTSSNQNTKLKGCLKKTHYPEYEHTINHPNLPIGAKLPVNMHYMNN